MPDVLFAPQGGPTTVTPLNQRAAEKLSARLELTVAVGENHIVPDSQYARELARQLREEDGLDLLGDDYL